MKNPAHPGAIIREELLNGCGLSLQQSAKMLGVPIKTLAKVFNKEIKVTPNLAYRLELAGINTARLWLILQANYDLAQYLNNKKREPKVDVVAFQKIQQNADDADEEDDELYTEPALQAVGA